MKRLIVRLYETHTLKELSKLYCTTRYQIEKILLKYNCLNRTNRQEYNQKYQKEYRKQHKDTIKEYQKMYRANNREYLRCFHKEYRKKNIEYYREYDRKRDKTPARIESKLKSAKKRRKENEIYKHRKRWRTILENTLKTIKQKKNGKTKDLLGYSPLDLKNHLERLFIKGMNWKNHGKWHIDHIRPITSFPLGTPVGVINKLDNLQPLWAKDNLKKSNSWEDQKRRS